MFLPRVLLTCNGTEEETALDSSPSICGTENLPVLLVFTTAAQHEGAPVKVLPTTVAARYLGQALDLVPQPLQAFAFSALAVKRNQ